jgi:hypothetical protein
MCTLRDVDNPTMIPVAARIPVAGSQSRHRIRQAFRSQQSRHIREPLVVEPESVYVIVAAVHCFDAKGPLAHIVIDVCDQRVLHVLAENRGGPGVLEPRTTGVFADDVIP